jgi:hypothetical protein
MIISDFQKNFLVRLEETRGEIQVSKGTKMSLKANKGLQARDGWWSARFVSLCICKNDMIVHKIKNGQNSMRIIRS